MKKISPIIKIIIFIIVIGFIIGILSTNQIKKENITTISFDETDRKIFISFINTFTYHYWSYFLIWLFGLANLGFILTYLLTFFKSLLYGVIFGVIIKRLALPGISHFIGLYFLEILILIPLLIYLTYQSVKKSMNINSIKANENYLQSLFITTFILILYAIIKTFIN